MDRLLAVRVGRTSTVRVAAVPLSGFPLSRQNSGLMVCNLALGPRVLHVLLVVAAALMGGLAMAEPIHAGGVREPIVPNIRPQPRPVPTPRISPRPQFAPAPRVSPGVGARPAPGRVNPGVVRPQLEGRDCIARCGSQCQTVSCSGLSVSQCNSVRQQCRMSCRSSCR